MTLKTGQAAVAAAASVTAGATAYETATFALSSLAMGAVAIIDTEKMKVTVNGANGRAVFSGEFWKLGAGTNTITAADDSLSRLVEIKVQAKDRRV